MCVRARMCALREHMHWHVCALHTFCHLQLHKPLVAAVVLCFILARRLRGGAGDCSDGYGWGVGDDGHPSCLLRVFSVQATTTAQMASPFSSSHRPAITWPSEPDLP